PAGGGPAAGGGGWLGKAKRPQLAGGGVPSRKTSGRPKQPKPERLPESRSTSTSSTPVGTVHSSAGALPRATSSTSAKIGSAAIAPVTRTLAASSKPTHTAMTISGV